MHGCAAPAGYSGFFDLVQVDEELLDNVYEHDLYLRDQVEQLARDMEALATSTRDPSAAMEPLRQQADALDRRLAQREDLLRGAEPDA